MDNVIFVAANKIKKNSTYTPVIDIGHGFGKVFKNIWELSDLVGLRDEDDNIVIGSKEKNDGEYMIPVCGLTGTILSDNGDNSNQAFSAVFENIKQHIGDEKAKALADVFYKFDAGLAAVDPQFAGLAAAIAEPMLGKKNAQEIAPTETKQTQAVKPGKKSEKEAATV